MRQRKAKALALGSALMLPLLTGMNCGGGGDPCLSPETCTRTCQEITGDLDALSACLFPEGSLPPPDAGSLYLCCGQDLLVEASDCGCEAADMLGTREEICDAIRTACETVADDCPQSCSSDDDDGEEPPDDGIDDPACGGPVGDVADLTCGRFPFSEDIIQDIERQADEDRTSGVRYSDALTNASDFCMGRFPTDPQRRAECVICAGSIVLEVYCGP